MITKPSGVSFICTFLLLTSCFDPAIDPLQSLPSREVHYDFSSGAKVGEKTFSYDANGKVVREYLRYVESPDDVETLYEYDADGHLIKKKERRPNAYDEFYVTEFNYANGLMQSENNYIEGLYPVYRQFHYYSGSLKDSTQMFWYSSTDKRYIYSRTVFYQYDDQLFLIKSFDKRGSVTNYRYKASLLTATCDVYDGYEGATYEVCAENEYNAAGQLTKILSTAPSGTQVREELFYKGRVLQEKKVYTYPVYWPSNTVIVVQIRYEY